MKNSQEDAALGLMREWLAAHGFVVVESRGGDSINWREDYVLKGESRRVALSSTRGDLDVYFGVEGVVDPILPDTWRYALDGTPVVLPRVDFAGQVHILIDRYEEFLVLAHADNAESQLSAARAHARKVVMSPPWHPTFGD